MKLHLRLNEDHLKLVRFINVEQTSDTTLSIDRKVMLRIQSHLLDDVAMILGLRDQAIPGTEGDPDGCAYPDDIEKRMLDAYNYVSDNLHLIENLLHQMCVEGVKPGHYVAADNVMIWERVIEERD